MQAGHRLLCLGDATAVAVLVAQPPEDASSCVALLGWSFAIGDEVLLRHTKVGAQLSLGMRCLPAVAGRLAVGEDSLQGLMGDAYCLQTDRFETPCTSTGRRMSDLSCVLENTPSSCLARRKEANPSKTGSHKGC